MLTQQEYKRFVQRHFDYSKVLDPAVKSEIIKEDIREATLKIEQLLKRTRGKVVIFISEMR